MPNRPATSEDEIVRMALSLPAHAQPTFIRDICGSDASLHLRVQERLACYESGAACDDMGDDMGCGDEDLRVVDPVGERVGPYRIVRSLGRGGMGEVFLAERADDQFEQRVAIKLVRRELLSRHVQGRLRGERQILATLDHPNIARLLDGGTTADGTPYIVMEYIQGEPIDAYCDKHRLSIEQRLKLFQIVCSAVHSAHQNLVVHRDLKPSNILVTDEGVPKLLDFGIAKLLDERQARHTLAITRADYRVLTLDHASPEQIRGEAVTTASDIYVLGILLYELLTGYKPFALRGNRLAELERMICEDPPSLPSATVGFAMFASPEDIDAIAAARKATASKMRRELRGDLDNIILMALRKEPERRYPSVEQLAADIQRYLDGLPVIARTDAWAYRAAKFMRRHAAAMTLILTTLLLLTGFAVTTFVQSQQIARERDRVDEQRQLAETQRHRAEEVSAFLVDLFKMSDPAEARGNEITAREILDRGAERIDRELRQQPELQATLLDTVGRVYLSLDLKDEAQPRIEQALEIRRALFGPDSNAVAASSLSLSDVLLRKGDLVRARQYASDAYSISLARSGAASLQTAAAHCLLGMIDQLRGELATAEENLRSCLRARERALSNDRELTEPLDNLARVLSRRGDYAGAERIYRRILEIDVRTVGRDHLDHARHLHNLATTLYGQRDYAQAEELYREALSAYRRILGPEHSETIDALSNLGRTLQARGDFDGAEDAYRTALALNRKARGPQHLYTGHDVARLAYLMYMRGNLDESAQLFRDALRIYAAASAPDQGYEAIALMRLGRVLVESNEAAEAVPLLRRSIELWRAVIGDRSFEYAQAQAYLGLALRQRGALAEACALLASSYETAAAARGSDDKDVLDIRTWMRETARECAHPMM